MGKLFPPPGSSTPKASAITLKDAYNDNHYEEEPPKEKKERKPKSNRERDLLIEAKCIFDTIKDYKFMAKRTTSKRIKELLEKIEQVLE